MPIIDKQMRFVELGRLRMGAKGAKGQPEKLAAWRLTSASKQLLDAAALIYGGAVRDWQGAPNDGYYELLTESAEIDVTIPPIEAPGALLSQWYELWSAGGCARRCDGVTEGISGQPCLCSPDNRQCKTVTRMSVMLPRLPGIGVWRLDTGGENAALELPGTFNFLAGVGAGRFVEATLRIEPRVKKVPGEGTRRFTVPVLNVPEATVGDLMAQGHQGVLGPAVPAPGKPALPAATVAPADKPFNGDKPGFGERAPLPEVPSPSEGEQAPPVKEPHSPPGEPRLTAAQAKKLNVLVGQLRDAGHITTEQLWRSTHREPVVSDDGELHWAPLREQLSKVEASELIERLEKYAANVAVAT